MLYEKQVVD